MTRVTSFGTLPHAGRDDVEVNLKERLGGGVNLEDGSSTLQIIEGLGQGGYAYVLKAKHVKTGDILALKVVPKKNAPRKRDRERLKLELEVMTALSPSPFVQRCLLAFESATHLYVGLELVGGGDLFFHLVKNITAHGWGFPEDEARVLLAETVLALTHLHDQGFIHRDVKVENIMLDSRGHVKLIDFGLASQLTRPEETLSPTGSLIYMAPEILTDQLGGRHTDWWALGVLSYELMTGRTPWSSLTDKKVIRKEIRTLKVMPPRRLSPAAGLFICSLLKHDRALRLGTKDDRELQAHKFFASVDWAATARQESAPALVPSGPVTNERDRLAVLAAYCRSTDQAAGGRGENEEWYLGLDQVRQDLPAESY